MGVPFVGERVSGGAFGGADRPSATVVLAGIPRQYAPRVGIALPAVVDTFTATLP